MGDEPEVCSCSALRQATRHVTRLYDAALAPAGLGLNQYAILARLRRLGPSRLGDLAAELVMDRSTLGHLLRPLQERSLVGLHVGERDRRSRLIVLTADGEALFTRARALWEAAEARFAEAFGRTRADALRATLKSVEGVTFKGAAR